MNPRNPNEYVAALKQNGVGDQAVIAILRNAGWSEKEAVAVLSSYYQALTGLAVPARPRSMGGPREAFLHLLSFLTLAVWCIAAGSLWFTLIDFWFPDPAARVVGDPLAGMARDLASVLVAFPVFTLVMRAVWRELPGQPAQADWALRRWLTYLALLVAAGAGLVALTLVLSFAKFGSPARQRLSASDDRRSEDLEAIATVIRNRWTAARGQEAPALPQSIKEPPESAALRLTDPISGEPYRYSPLGGARYELCARFQADTTRLPAHARRSLFRVHPAGNYCFVVDAPASLP